MNDPPIGAHWDRSLDEAHLVFLDLETTGTDPATARICELAAIRREAGREVGRLVGLVGDAGPVGPSAQVHGLSDEALADAPSLASYGPRLGELLEGAVVVGHAIEFDLGFLRAASERGELPAPPSQALDTRRLAKRAWHRPSYGLRSLCERDDLPLPSHRAEPDAVAAEALFDSLLPALRAPTLRHLWQAQRRERPVQLRDDVRETLEACRSARRVARIAYRVPGRDPFQDELHVYDMTGSHVEGRLVGKGVVRVLRGDRILWALPTQEDSSTPEGFHSRCPRS